MINVAFSRLFDRLVLADPGLLRFSLALRSTLCCSLVGAIAIAWNTSHGQSLMRSAFAVAFAMIAPLFVRDASRVQWCLSLAILYVSACGSFLAAAALQPWPLWGDVGFLVVFFVGILCQACGPRAAGSALTAIVTYYLGCYLRPDAAALATAVPLSWVGIGVIVLVGQVLLPVRPAATLRRAIDTVVLRAHRLLRQRPLAGISAIDRQTSELNEAALALERYVGLLAPPDADALRAELVELEVAAGQYRVAVLERGSDAASDVASDAASDLASGARSDVASDTLPAAIASLRAAIDALARHANRAFIARSIAAAVSPLTARHPAAPRSTIGESWRDFRAGLGWLAAARATTAALLAMRLGYALSPDRWYWAVITAFVVFLGTRSRADTIYRGLQRMAGTLAGALLSAALALTLHGATAALVTSMVVCVFGWAYFILNAYARGVFFITALVGLVYAELGFAIVPLLEIRIAEVLLGCLVSVIVAAAVRPLSASRHIDARMLEVLLALRAAIVANIGTTNGTADDGTLGAHAMRTLDSRWHELRLALRPFQTERLFVWTPGYEQVTAALLACLHWVRTLSRQTARAATMRDDAHRAEAILSHLDSLIDAYRGNASLSARPTHEPLMPARYGDAAGPIDLLAQLDGAVAQLAERLAHTGTGRSRVHCTLRPRARAVVAAAQR